MYSTMISARPKGLLGCGLGNTRSSTAQRSLLSVPTRGSRAILKKIMKDNQFSRSFTSKAPSNGAATTPARAEKFSHPNRIVLPFDKPDIIFAGKGLEELEFERQILDMCTKVSVNSVTTGAYTLSKTLKMGFVSDVFLKNTFFMQFCGGETLEHAYATSLRLAKSVPAGCKMNVIYDYAVEADALGEGLREASEVIEESIVQSRESSEDGQGFSCFKVTGITRTPELVRKLNDILQVLDRNLLGLEAAKVPESTRPAALRFVPPYGVADASEWQNQGQEVDRIWADMDKATFAGIAEESDLAVKQQLESIALNSTPATASEAGNNARLILSIIQSKDYADRIDAEIARKNDMLSGEEWKNLKILLDGCHRICAAAEKHRLPVLIDAEQTFYQIAVDAIALGMMRLYNRSSPFVYSTHQMYLKDGLVRLNAQKRVAKSEGYGFATKLVRGAYVSAERKLATSNNMPSPIHENIQMTHTSFDLGVQALVGDISEDVGIMIASHNKASIQGTVDLMVEKDISTQHPNIAFAQLLGMGDSISYALSYSGLNVYKYVPFGPIDLVMPYMLRRLEENSSMLGGSREEVALLNAEIQRRTVLDRSLRGMGPRGFRFTPYAF